MSSALQVEVVRFADLGANAADMLLVPERQISSLRAHPFANAQDPAAVVLRRGERTVGRYGLFPGRMRVDGQERSVVWGSDWRVDNAVRGPAAGLLLLRALREAPTLAGIGPSASAIPLYRASGFAFARLRRVVIALRGRAAMSAGRSAPLAVAFGAAAEAVGRLHVLRSRRKLSRARVGWRGLERFRPAHDVIAATDHASDEFPRDHLELNWIIAHPWLGPETGYRYVAIEIERLGVLMGFALTRIRPRGAVRLGSLLRYAVRPDEPEGVALVVAAAMDALDTERADLMEVCTTDDRLVRATRLIGGFERSGMEAIARSAADGHARLGQNDRGLAGFRLGIGDGDVVFA